MSISIGVYNFSGLAFGKVSGDKTKGRDLAQLSDAKDEEKTLAEKFAAAVEEYKEKALRGLNALTEAEIEERLNEFRALHKPENGTEEELAAFYEKLAAFEKKLRMFVRGPSLITPSTGGAEADDDGSIISMKEQLSMQQVQFRVKQTAE